MKAINRDGARIALGAIRLINGAGAILLPTTFGNRIGIDIQASRGTVYILRLFGIRTVLLGWQLLGKNKAEREQALRVAVLIHATDTAAALAAGLSGHLTRKAAVTATVISGINTGLAVIASRT